MSSEIQVPGCPGRGVAAQALADAAEIELERVAGMDGELVLRIMALHPLNDVTVDFHDMQVLQALQQRLGHGAQARANFHHAICRLWVDGLDQAVDDSAVGQEVLAKTLFGDMFHSACLR